MVTERKAADGTKCHTSLERICLLTDVAKALNKDLMTGRKQDQLLPCYCAPVYYIAKFPCSKTDLRHAEKKNPRVLRFVNQTKFVNDTISLHFRILSFEALHVLCNVHYLRCVQR